ncbi:MAG: flagellin hook IN motif-containing protein [Pseudomonadota bacterium]
MDTSFLSSSARTGIQTLKSFNDLFGRTSERLATGLKVNRASDGPTAFFTAKALNDRAGDLNRVIDGVSTKIGTVQAAEVGGRALQRLVQLAEGIVNAAAALPAPDPTATGTVNVAAEGDVTNLSGVSDGDQFSVQVGADAAVTVTVSSGDTPDDLLAQLNAIDSVSASFTSGGELQISSTNGEDLVLSEVAGAPLAGLGISAGTFDQSTGTSPARAAKAAEFDAVLTQINQLAGDSSFLGVNLLSGDSPVVQLNPDGSSSLTLAGVDAGAAGLGISGAANGFQSNADISTARSELRGALNSLRGFSARLSTDLSVIDIRDDFNKNLRNTLEAGAAKLTLTDPNEEGANLLALKTRTSLAAASFSITQRAEAGVLRLFG